MESQAHELECSVWDEPRSLRPVLLVNTAARTGERNFELARQALLHRGVRLVDAVPVKDPADMARLTEAAVNAGSNLLIVGGGDGTFNAVANVLAQRPVTLGLLPLGTGNDFARSLGIARSLESACDAIAWGRRARVDLGRVNGRFFLNAASVGLTTEITRKLSPRLKKVAGKLAFAVSAVTEAFNVPVFQAELELDAERMSLSTLQIVVGNGRYHGAGHLIAPEATLDDHHLDVYAILPPEAPEGTATPWKDLQLLAQVAWGLPRGEHVDHPSVIHLRTQSLVLRTDPILDADVDGELLGQTPLHLAVVPSALQVLAPSTAPALPRRRARAKRARKRVRS
jgi:YegS/Rv2252/BmrU family lipid kinase